MPQHGPRTLSEQEFNAIRDRVLASMPEGMTPEQFEKLAPSVMAGAIAEAENLPAEAEGSALGRFASNAWNLLNPITMVKGVAQAVTHPIDTGKAIANAQLDQFSQSLALARQGRYLEAGGHAVAGALPLAGPIAAQAGEQIAEGDVAGGLGTAAGVLAPMGVRPAVQAVRQVIPSGARASVAGSLEAGAAERVADVMAPKLGPNKVRLGNTAARVAPELLKNPELTKGAFSRQGFQQNVTAAFEEAAQQLDDAANARNANLVYHTAPIVRALRARRERFVAQTARKGGLKAGEDVVPGPNQARVAAIDKAIAEVEQLGPVARYESIRRIREAWDQPAKAKYNPSITQDYLKVSGEASGAADVTGVLREKLASFDPQTAKANQQFSLMKAAKDVLEATEEIERTRPKVGRQIVARMTGSVVGGQAAGAAGAVSGWILGPVLESALSSGVTTKIQTARLMQSLADSIRSGNVGKTYAFSERLRRMAPSGARMVEATVERATAPGMAAEDQEATPPAGAQR